MRYIILFCLLATPALADQWNDQYEADQAQFRANEMDNQQTYMQERLDEMENENVSQPQYAEPESVSQGYSAPTYIPAIDPNPPINVVGGEMLGQ